MLLFTITQAQSDAVPHLDRSRLTLIFDESFAQPPSFYDAAKAPHGRWKTNFAFGVQDPGSDKAWENRTLRPNNEQQYYGDPFRGTNPFEWGKGKLRIVGRKSKPDELERTAGMAFISGLVTTEKSFDHAYGYFEARIRMPVGRGLWPAFWLMPRFRPQTTANIPQPLSEVDVVENIGVNGEVYMSAHYGTRDKPGHDVKRIKLARVDEPHNYGVLIRPADLVWYIDDVEVRRAPNRDFHEPAYMLLNMAIGGDWPGAPDNQTRLPAIMEVDWVRAYALKSQSAP